MYSVVDLFAGAGGLSLGFRQTQKFEIKAAFEKNLNAQKTYIKNHKDTDMYKDVCTAVYEDIINKYGRIDVVIGGPPCQGFSNANRQKNHAISQNNILVKEYVRAILELNPKAFIMENVSMLKSNVHRFYMNEDDIKVVERYEIPTIQNTLVLLEETYADKTFLQIVQNIDLINKYLWTEADYLLLNVVYRRRKNNEKCKKTLIKYKKKLLELAGHLKEQYSDQDEILKSNYEAAEALEGYFLNALSVKDTVDLIERTIMIQRMLSKAKELFDNKIVVDRYTADGPISAVLQSFAVLDYIKNILESDDNGYTIDDDVLCAASFGVPQKRMRYVIMGIKKNISESAELPKGCVSPNKYATVEDAMLDISMVPTIVDASKDKGIPLEDIPRIKLSKLADKLRDSDILYNHIITATRETAKKRFAVIKQGENFHSLDASMKEDTYTDASRTQNTIYLRLKYDEPSGTVVNVRKSMWIHPEHNRAVSIREAARLQTFPDSFRFEGTKDSQYQQVGNAVPPILAEAIAEKLAELLDNSNCNYEGE
jgi:DNA (cytosine-5)-methyltransferase 1